jgi:methionyl-tRNA formyltransferase
MRILFWGTPDFATPALRALTGEGMDVVGVVTQPDRPRGRSRSELVPSPVKLVAMEEGLPLLQPESPRTDAFFAEVQALEPDLSVVVAYGHILPRAVVDLPPRGTLNIHASLLPRWRGAAPIQRALLAGDRETGISIMQMDEGLDTGPVLAQRSVPVGDDDDAGSLHERLAELGAEMIVAALTEIAAGRARPLPQPPEGATYARKLAKHETQLDWTHPAAELERAVRAFRPTPGASTRLDGEPLKLWRARVVAARLAPGEIAGGLVVGCGQGALEVLELQRPGGKRLSAAEFLRGHPLAPGAHFQ